MMNEGEIIFEIILLPIVYLIIFIIIIKRYKLKRKALEFKVVLNFMVFIAFVIDVCFVGTILFKINPIIVIILYSFAFAYLLYVIPYAIKTIHLFKNKIKAQTQTLSDLIRASSEISVSVSNNATELAASASEVNAASEEIAATTIDITLKAKNQAESLRIINQRAQNITKIAKAIKKISEQTNLLALNASIEAGRAGEHGRGFAVVAERVQKLAEEARQSVEETGQIIETITKDIENATKDSLGISKAIEEISTAAEEQTASMEEISATSGILGSDAESLRVQLSIYDK
jgi:chromosome segregation ATPase